ncbi:hypothetical protein LIER_09962 [Lithospermum erythrorhizon]|uniref:Uncharacterized protein n=1 Tax=Lithospermum erythrorhizon TaxID=34254 RepID=A0AAV3PIV1_LITER
MNPIVAYIGMLSLVVFTSTYMITTFPKASADDHCSNGKCYENICSSEECDPDIPYPKVCQYGCHCLDYGDGNKCQPHKVEKGTQCVSHGDCSFKTTKDVVGYCYHIFGDVADGVCTTRPIKS